MHPASLRLREETAQGRHLKFDRFNLTPMPLVELPAL